MKIIDLLKIAENALVALSDNGIRTDDVWHIALFNDYENLRSAGEKTTYITALLADKYNTSESSVKRIVRRLNKQVKL